MNPPEAGAWLEDANGKRISIRSNCLIGRSPKSSVVLDSPKISRRHAIINVQDIGEFWLIDLGSSNGTYVNGERIDAYRVLQVDDRIDIGPYSFRFTGRSLAQSCREGNLRIVAHNLSRTVRSRSGTPLSRSGTT